MNNKLTIDLRGRQLTHIPEEVFEHKQLRALHLGYNCIAQLSPRLAELQQLRELTLTANRLQAFPEVVLSLPRLEVLGLGNNCIPALPEEIACLSKLRHLYVQQNCLQDLPAGLSALSSLRVLQLQENFFQQLPGVLLAFPALQRLTLSLERAAAQQLPADLSAWARLQHLSLSSAGLNSLPAALEACSSLKFVNLSYNHFDRFPQVLLQLPSLQTLILKGNLLTGLPPEIGQLQTLTHLDLSHNQLSSLPQELQQLRRLRSLQLASNQLKNLPAGLAALPHLSNLDLSSNQLTEVEAAWLQAPALKTLSVAGNPLKKPPLPAMDLAGMKRYFELLDLQGEERMHEMKLVVVGPAQTGKSSLCNALCGLSGQTEQTAADQQKETHLRRWTISPPHFDGEHELRVNIWDVGRREMETGLYPLLFSPQAIYLLVLDASKTYSFHELAQWLSLIGGSSQNSPVLILRNKADTGEAPFGLGEIRRQFPFVLGEMPLSLLPGHEERLEILRLELLYLLRKRRPVAVVGQCVPKAWQPISRQLLELQQKQPFLSWRSFADRCAAYGLQQQETLRLAEWLHQVGRCLYMRTHSGSLLLLNPGWLLHCMDQLLAQPPLAAGQACLPASTWKDLISREAFGGGEALWLQALRSMGVCYELPNGDLLFPHFLPELPLPFPHEDAQDALLWEYHYDFLPAGLFASFLIRNYHRTHPDYRGKNALILRYQHSSAQLCCLQRGQVPAIRVMVSGPERTQLRELIRILFEEIHGQYPATGVRYMIPCGCAAKAEQQQFFDKKMLENLIERKIWTVSCDACGRQQAVHALLDGYRQLHRKNFDHVRWLVGQGELDTALKAIEAYSAQHGLKRERNEAISQLARLGRLQAGQDAGTKDAFHFEKELNVITDAVLKLLNDLEDPHL